MDIKYNGEPAAEPKLGTLHRHRTVDVKDDDYIRLGAVADSSSVELLVRSDKDDSDSVSSHSSGKAGEEETKWHLLPPSEVLSILNTSSSGLSTDDANQRLKKCGPNIYDESELLDKFHNKVRVQDRVVPCHRPQPLTNPILPPLPVSAQVHQWHPSDARPLGHPLVHQLLRALQLRRPRGKMDGIFGQP